VTSFENLNRKSRFARLDHYMPAPIKVVYKTSGVDRVKGNRSVVILLMLRRTFLYSPVFISELFARAWFSFWTILQRRTKIWQYNRHTL